MHSTSFKTALTVTMVIGIAFAAPQPENSDISNEITSPGGFISKKGESVSASWGGFQAAATLNEDGSAVASAGGNGLGAGAGYGTGGAGAGAGVEYGVAGAGAAVQPPVAAGGYGNGGKPGKPGHTGMVGGTNLYQQGGPGNGFFDRIFAIPINVLQSVNTYLNQKQQYQGQQVSTHGQQNNNGGATFAGASATAGSASYGGPDKVPEASVGADYGHQSAGVAGAAGVAGSAGAAGHGKHHGAPMMIPITALRSVQNLLNG